MVRHRRPPRNKNRLRNSTHPADADSYTRYREQFPAPVEEIVASTPRKRGRPGVTLDDVRLASDALKAQGRVVGPTNVRLELGRGSFETIVKHLRALGYERKKQERK